VALSGHNINFDGSNGYFYSLHTLRQGAVIQYETALGRREYAVESVTEIAETDWTRLGRTEDNRITLITCISGKPALRLCVQAVEIQP
jgi:LPXTG-site transpeptidase (sortase) family protein